MYHANESRYETMKYHRCGDSGLMLPEVLWASGTISEIPVCMKI